MTTLPISSRPDKALSNMICSSLLIVLLLEANLLVECRNEKSSHLRPFTTTGDINNKVREPGKMSPRREPEVMVQQSQINADDYENMSQRELKDIEEGKLSSSEHQQAVVPSQETNGNSQVVYVNLARVVGDKNDTARAISGHHQVSKQDGQIVCGETNKNGKPSTSASNDPLQNRIVGGSKAEPGEFPFQVRLNIRSRRGSSLCGGVIIDQRHILTAAHCMTTWYVWPRDRISTTTMRMLIVARPTRDHLTHYEKF